MNETDYIEWFEERAAIAEFDGGLDRIEAQRLAYWEFRKHFEHVATPEPILQFAKEFCFEPSN